MQRTLSEVIFENRKQALQQKPHTNKTILPFVTQYHPSVTNLKQIRMKNWHLIERQSLLREIYKEPPLISYKRGRSLKGYRSFRYKVVSLQIEVDSLHHDRFATLRSRFATCLEFEVTIKDTGVNKRYLQTTYYRQIVEANIKTSFRYALLLFVPRSEKNHWSRNHCVNARAK